MRGKERKRESRVGGGKEGDILMQEVNTVTCVGAVCLCESTSLRQQRDKVRLQ